MTWQLQKGNHRSVEVHFPWVYPAADFFKLNCDGASNHLGYAGIGGVIRSDQGGYQACFSKHIFKNDNNMVEVCSIRDGLVFAKELGIKKLEVESDSTFAIQLCEKEIQIPWSLKALVEDTQHLKACFDVISFNQRYTEAIQWQTTWRREELQIC